MIRHTSSSFKITLKRTGILHGVGQTVHFAFEVKSSLLGVKGSRKEDMLMK